MKELEKKIVEQYHAQLDEIPLPDFEEVWTKMEKRREKKMIPWRKSATLVAAIAVMFLAVSVTNIGPFIVDASEGLLSKIFGVNNIEEIDPEVSAKDILQAETTFLEVKSKLTEEEFQELTISLQEMTQYIKKMTVVESGQSTQKIELLTKEEQNRLAELDVKVQKYLQKAEDTKEGTLAKTKDLTLLPTGYEITETLFNESSDGQPIIRKVYNKGEMEIHTILSGILPKEEDEFTLRNPEKVTIYEENGVTILHGTNPGSNVEQMKAVINNKDGMPSYQIYVSASSLTKDEMVKIILDLASKK